MKPTYVALLCLASLALAACGSAAPASTPAPSASAASVQAAAPASAAAKSAGSASAAAKPEGGASASAAKPAASGQLTRVTISNIGVSGGIQPLWIALDGGYFRNNGLDVTSLSSTTSSSATVSALMAGQLNVAWTDGTNAVNANASGADLVVLATIHPAYSYLLEVPADIKTPDQLKGKKLAVSNLTGTDSIASRLALTRLGVDWQKDVTFVATGDNASRTAALLSGAVQGTLQEPPGSLKLEAQGFHALADLTPMNLPSANASLILDRGYVNANRATVQKFMDSLVQAIARNRNDRAFSLSILKKYFPDETDSVLNTIYDYYRPDTPSLPFPKVELFKPGVDELSKANPKVAEVDLSKMIDTSFIQSAADRKLDQ